MSRSICRICLNSDHHMTSLFKHFDGITLRHKMMSCTSVHVECGDELPSEICLSCVDRLNCSYDFKLLCENSDKILKERIHNNKLSLYSDETVQVKEELTSEVDLNCLGVKCEVQYDSANDNSDSVMRTLERKSKKNKPNNENSQLPTVKILLKDVMISKTTEENDSLGKNRNDDVEFDRFSSNYSSSDDTDNDETPLSKKYNLNRKRIGEQIKDNSSASYKKRKETRQSSCEETEESSSNKNTKKSKKSTSKEKKKSHKKRTEPTGTWRLKAPCQTCGKVLANRQSLKIHMSTHAEKKQFQCKLCKCKFSVAYTLKIHERKHTGEKPFLCVDCGKSFYTNTLLIHHRRIHTGEKPYKCTICPSTYRLPGNLRHHMRVHKGERKYECQICGKRFISKEYLKSHLLTHTGERNYMCNVCGKKMSRGHHLKMHMMTHTGERPYKCEICYLSFIQKTSYKQHLEKHRLIEMGTSQQTEGKCENMNVKDEKS